jgi:RNA polymerase sigma-70 factor (ECF subfamily)
VFFFSCICNILLKLPSICPVDPISFELLPDKSLVDLVLRGDQRAFAVILRRTERLVVQIVHRMIADPHLRKDILQEVYMKAWQHLPGFRQEAKLSTWIARIAYHACVDEIRRSQGAQAWTVLPEAVSPDEADAPFLAREMTIALQEGIDHLPPIYKTLVVLYHQEEQRYEDIVRITGLPLGTVKNYLFRARKRLAEAVRHHYKMEGS